MKNIETLSAYSSVGHRLSNSEHIDAHFEASRKYYEIILNSVKIQPNWHVLDLGCGSGGFLPLIAKQVGAKGRIDAIDLAHENIEKIKTTLKGLDTAIQTRVGSILKLPYENNTYDAIWCANVTQYLDNDELKKMLEEAIRVIKPGGLLAIKEFDNTTLQFYPFQPSILWRWLDKAEKLNIGFFRTINLPNWMKKSGFNGIKQESFWEEFRAPLSSDEKKFVSNFLRFLATEALELDLLEADLLQWRKFESVDLPDNPINDSEFCYRESHLLVVGKKPYE